MEGLLVSVLLNLPCETLACEIVPLPFACCWLPRLLTECFTRGRMGSSEPLSEDNNSTDCVCLPFEAMWFLLSLRSSSSLNKMSAMPVCTKGTWSASSNSMDAALFPFMFFTCRKFLASSLPLLFPAYMFGLTCCTCDLPSLWWELVDGVPEGLLNPFNTSDVVRLLYLWVCPSSIALSRATYIWASLEVLFVREPHSDDRLETNLSTNACSLLLMSSIGVRSTRPSDEEIFEDVEVCVRRGSAVTLMSFPFCCSKNRQHPTRWEI